LLVEGKKIFNFKGRSFKMKVLTEVAEDLGSFVVKNLAYIAGFLVALITIRIIFFVLL